MTKFHISGAEDEYPCRVCLKPVLRNKPDPCLGFLPGIAQACCGHGHERPAYCVGWGGCKPGDMVFHNTQRSDYFEKRGKEAIEYMNSLRTK